MTRRHAVRPLLTLACVSWLTVFAAPALAQGYQLVWSDEFDGTAVDLTKWSFQIGDGCPGLCGWGNNELQYYRSQNATVSGGLLTIAAKQESYGGQNYTSARLRSLNLGDWTYGRIEMRAKLPIGQGMWPAFWMLPTASPYGGWAASGEIDIMEAVGSDPARVFGTLHYGDAWPNNVSSQSGPGYRLSSGSFNDAFHTFALEWEPGEMRWFVDGQLYSAQNDWYSVAGAYPAPFDVNFHLLLNLAVGGNLPGPPDGTTVFPQEYVIDYVRVYQKPEFPGCRIVFAGMDHADPLANGWFTFNGIASGGIGGVTGSVAPVSGNTASVGAGWSSGGTPGFFGGFGRTNPHDLTGMTHFTFWINPDHVGQDYTIMVQLQDDDNGDNIIPANPDGADDEFQYDVVVNGGGGDAQVGGGWQKISIPLASFYDDNSFHWGGNGVFDPVPTSKGGNGQLVNVVISLVSNSGADINFITDRWEFTREEGAVEGYVWWDQDGNGVRDAGETGVSGVLVRLFDDQGSALDSVATSGSGFYNFGPFVAGEYRVSVDTTSALSGAIPTRDPDGVLSPHFAWLPVDCSGTLSDQDFGYQPVQVGLPGFRGEPGATLSAGMPNPFTSSTRMEFTLDRSQPVGLSVFSVRGRRVRTLMRGTLPAGRHDVVWDGRDETGLEVADGVYLMVLRTPRGSLTRRTLRVH